MSESKKFVYPGELIASEEELIDSKGTYTDAQGGVHAAVPGFLEMNPSAKTASVSGGPKEIKPVEKGAVVYGVITNMTSGVAILELRGEEGREHRSFLPDNSGVIPIAMAANSYVRSLKDCFHVGDYVKARVVAIETGGLKLTTKDPGLWVVWSACSKCRHALKLSGNALKCANCNFL